jgi:hypothetical protein
MTDQTVYIVLYYCSDKMFNIVKLMFSLEKAYSFICEQESKMFYQEYKKQKLLCIDSQQQINEHSNSSEESLGICFVKKNYMNLKFDMNKISEYIIVSKLIE